MCVTHVEGSSSSQPGASFAHALHTLHGRHVKNVRAVCNRLSVVQAFPESPTSCRQMENYWRGSAYCCQAVLNIKPCRQQALCRVPTGMYTIRQLDAGYIHKKCSSSKSMILLFVIISVCVGGCCFFNSWRSSDRFP